MKKVFKYFSLFLLSILLLGCSNGFNAKPKDQPELENPNNFTLELESNSIKMKWTNTDSDSIFFVHKYYEDGTSDFLFPSETNMTTLTDSNVEPGVTYDYVLVKIKIDSDSASRAALTNDQIITAIGEMSQQEYEEFLKALNNRFGYLIIDPALSDIGDKYIVKNTTSIAATITNNKLTTKLIENMGLKVSEGYNAAYISWTPIKNAEQYILYRINSDDSCKFIGLFSNNAELSYIDKDVSNNQKYRYLLFTLSPTSESFNRAITNEELIDAIEGMSILQFYELQRAMKETLGIDLIFLPNSNGSTSNSYINVEKNIIISSSYVDIILKNVEAHSVTLNSYNLTQRTSLIDTLEQVLSINEEDAISLADNVPSIIADNINEQDANQLVSILKKKGFDASINKEGKLSEDSSKKYSVILYSYEESYKSSIANYLKNNLRLSDSEIENGLNNLPFTVKENLSKDEAKKIINTIKSSGGFCSVESGNYILNFSDNETKPVYKNGLYTVILKSFNSTQKIPVIKAIREITGLGLGEAKALVESAPAVVREKLQYSEALEICKKIKEAGGSAEMIRTSN